MTIDPRADIGHVHLKVADLDRALAFYEGLLGFEVQARTDWGVFLSAGGYHHHLALNTYYSGGADPAPREAAGLHHFAIRYPTRAALEAAVRTLIEAGFRSGRRAITAIRWPSTSATPTTTVSSSCGIARARSGGPTGARSTSRRSSPAPDARARVRLRRLAA